MTQKTNANEDHLNDNASQDTHDVLQWMVHLKAHHSVLH